MRITQGLFIIGNGIEAHYDYALFGAVTRSVSASTITDNTFTTENPFRFPSPGGLGRIFSSEYLDDTLGLVFVTTIPPTADGVEGIRLICCYSLCMVLFIIHLAEWIF